MEDEREDKRTFCSGSTKNFKKGKKKKKLVSTNLRTSMYCSIRSKDIHLHSFSGCFNVQSVSLRCETTSCADKPPLTYFQAIIL